MLVVKSTLLSHTTTTNASTSLKSCSRGTYRQTAVLWWSVGEERGQLTGLSAITTHSTPKIIRIAMFLFVDCFQSDYTVGVEFPSRCLEFSCFHTTFTNVRGIYRSLRRSYDWLVILNATLSIKYKRLDTQHVIFINYVIF